MTPAARLQATIDILAGLEATRQPADRYLRDWFRARRYAGSKDRKAVTERVFACLRGRDALAARMGGSDPRALVIASLLAEDTHAEVIDTLFSGERYAPERLSDSERAALMGEGGAQTKSELPPFLMAQLQQRFGDALTEELAALSERAPVDLRVNTLKATREDVLAALNADGFKAEPTPHSPLGIRIPPGEGLSALSKSQLFANGAFEFQDEAAQIASMLLGAKPGTRVLDLGAGAGGKSLALAAIMQNKGEIVAYDTDAKRLANLEPRAARAGATIIRPTTSEPGGQFDAIFLDAPCSGSGTWRRQPELKWRLTEARLQELMALQDELLDLAARLMHPRGRILYATCSVLPCENQGRIEAFLARHPGFSIRPMRDAWREAGGAPWKATGQAFAASPQSTGTDGFFAAMLVRKKAASSSLDKAKAPR